jgi:hypothetical protein
MEASGILEIVEDAGTHGGRPGTYSVPPDLPICPLETF